MLTEPNGRLVALLRHPTPDVAAGLCYGRLDVPLAATAAAETARLLATLLHPGADQASAADWRSATVWSSPRRRCRLPAGTIARALGAVPVRVDERLREMDFGAWEGQSWSMIDRASLDAWAARLADYTPPNGENGASLIRRVSAFWHALPLGAHVIVSHGGPLKVLRALANDLPIDLARPAPGFGTVEVVRCDSRSPGALPLHPAKA